MDKDVFKPRILIVEDEAIIASSIISCLKRAGMEIVGRAMSGREAIESALLHQPDIILMDIRLEGPMTGIEAAEQICAIQPTDIIFLTANESLLHDADFRFPREFGFVQKPFLDEELYAAIFKYCTTPTKELLKHETE